MEQKITTDEMLTPVIQGYTKKGKSQFVGVRIVKVISETKRKGCHGSYPKPGYKRVMAVVSIRGKEYTRHVDTKDGVFGIMK